MTNNYYGAQNAPHASTQNGPNPTNRDVAEDQFVGDVIDTNDLFKGEREIRIRHNNTLYRLRSTRFGKLLLTK
ncbi:MAG: hemin uptake protein HemP [Rhizobiales bacterium]|nr:hemin uptake protein HemP [Hyphomicrobiales bacterium]